MKNNKKPGRRQFVKSTVLSASALPFASLGLWNHSHDEDWQLGRVHNNWESDDPFLSGNNYPVFEERYIKNLRVSGEIPEDIKGIFLRNGPNPRYKPRNYNYPFSGDGMLHGIFFDENRVDYRNKWVQTSRLQADKKAGEDVSDNGSFSNTNVLQFADKILSLADVGQPYELDSELNTLGIWGKNRGTNRIVAHPRIDHKTGEMHFFSYSMFTAPYLTYVVLDKNGELLRDQAIDIPSGSMIHDCALTENYAIFFDCPVVPNLDKARKGENPFEWKPEKGTVVGIIDRNDASKPPKLLTTEPFFVWHFMNAFEKDGALLIDLVRHNLVPFTSASREYKYLPTTLHRMMVNLGDYSIKHQDLDNSRIEFPTIDVRRTGEDYRFGYAPIIHPDHLNKKLPEYFSQLAQYDIKNGTSRIHTYGKNRYSGEAVFVPKSGTNDDAEGYVMSFVYDESTQKSDIVILDPLNFDKEPIATIHLPFRVPNGLHGNWIGS